MGNMEASKPKELRFQFSYIGSSNILPLISFILKLKDKTGVTIPFFWEYESIDEDIKELGEIMVDTHSVPLELKEV